MQYSRMAEYYDTIYAFKNYSDEVKVLLELIKPNLKPGRKALLDVACGTGQHLKYLKQHFVCEGLDISPELLEIAAHKLPDVKFHLADMIDFDLGKKFDLITCFFGSIGHVKTLENLTKTVQSIKRHLREGGLLIIEPWHTPEQFKAGRTDLLTVDEPDLKLARCCSSQVKGNLSILEMHHLVCTPAGTEHFIETLELGLFEAQDYIAALSEGGFTVRHEKLRSNGNGVYLVYKN
jgi:SAM-dependent methyltransferase